jgi:hypothetical protein
MSNATEIVNAFMLALEEKDYTRAGGYLADTFFFSGFTPQPLSKGSFLEVMSGLAVGFPDLVYHFHTVHEGTATEEGTLVKGTVRITGTQTDSFTLPPLGLAPIPQTAKSIALPETTWEFLVRDNAIASIRADHVPGGDIEGLLNQLGISDPIIQ